MASVALPKIAEQVRIIVDGQPLVSGGKSVRPDIVRRGRYWIIRLGSGIHLGQVTGLAGQVVF